MAVDKLVDSTQLNADLTSIANAIRAKGGTSAQMTFPNGFVSAINDISVGNANVSQDEDGYIVLDDEVPSGNLLDVDKLAMGTSPSGDIVFSSAISIRKFFLQNNSAITSIRSDSIEVIGHYAFSYMPSLKSVYLSNLNTIKNTDTQNPTTNSAGFFLYECPKLEKVVLPELVNMYGSYCIANSGAQTESGIIVVLPKIVNLGIRALRQCKCEAVDLGPDLDSIGDDCIYNGTYNNLILRKQSVVPTSGVNSILDAKNVYVPSALIESYKVATNWSARYEGGFITFHAIEGSQYEHNYADGTPIE